MKQWLRVNRVSLGLFLGIVVIYFLVRLPNLTLQPIFADEAIYVRWAQVMRAEATLRFLPLTDGKTPLYMWLLIPLFKFFHDPLLAGRSLSVISGLFTLVGVTFLGWRFSSRIGLVAALLYSLTPLTVFFDRMALVDAMLAAFTIWSLNAALLLLKFPRIDLAMGLGYLLGGSWLTKTPGSLNLLMLPTTILAFNFRQAHRSNKIVKLFGLWMIAIGIALVMYNLLRLGPSFSSLTSRNEDYIFSPVRLLKNPLDPLLPHLGDLRGWAATLLGWPISLLIVWGTFLALIKRRWIAVAILAWAGLPFLAEMLLIKTFTARYILFSVPPMLVLAAWGLDSISHLWTKLGKLGWIAVLGILIAWPIYFNCLLLFDIQKAPLPPNERRGYLEDWTAGYALGEIANYLIDQAKSGTIVVGTEGSFGTLPDGLLIYLDDYLHQSDHDHTIALVPGKATISAELKQAVVKNRTFFVSNRSRFPETSGGVTVIKSYPKAVNPKYPTDAMILFKVNPI